jgi:hypothetical protein
MELEDIQPLTAVFQMVDGNGRLWWGQKDQRDESRRCVVLGTGALVATGRPYYS